MELKGRNLRVNMKGDDVKKLQRALRQLGFPIEGEEGRFGKATIQAVKTFQKDHKLESTGEVDEDTANLIRDALAQRSDRSEFTKDKATYSVSGYVRTTQNIPVPDIVVEAFDRKVGRKTLLSPEVEEDKVKTNEEGFYRIDYTGRLEGLTKHPQVDLYVLCYARDDEKKTILDTSDLLMNAPRNATVNLTVPKELRPAPTEFERLSLRIRELVGEGDLAGLDGDDYEYLATKLKLDIRKIKGVVHALLLAQQASKYETDPAVPADILYAFTSGDVELPDIKSLVSKNRSSLKQTIQEAIGKEIIPSVDEEEINQIVAALKEIAVAIAVEEPEDSLAYSLRNQIDILDTVPQELRDDFIRDYTLNEQGDAKFWEELKKNEKFGEHLPSIQDLFALADLTQKNLPLIRSLYRKNKNVGEFAKWRIQDWQDYLRDNELPLPQDGREFTAEQYAQTLAHDFKRQFPMVDLIDGLERSQVLTGENRPSDALKLFLSAHPDLDLGKIPVNRYVRRPHVKEEFERKLEEAESAEERARIKSKQEKLVKELRDVQLAHALAPSTNHNACVAALRAFELEKPRYPAPQPVSERGEEESQIESVKAKTGSVLEIADRGILDLAKWFLLGEKSQRTGQSQTEPLAVRKIKADSVLRITSMNKADFITAWQELREKDGATDSAALRGEAEEIYNRARYQAFGFAVNAWNVAAPLSSITPAFVPNTYTNIQAQLPDISSDTALTIANLTTLFGNQHYCECQHCQSIYSPAAYLVQLHDSLSEKARGVLFRGRRPDIQGLHLNCENTNTKLPYIDLVIEQLERLVSIWESQLIPSEGEPHYLRMNLQTTLSEKELALRPEHELSDAYVVLASLPYPISIPWDKWFEEARLYLDYMDLPLWRLVEVFIPAFSNTIEFEGGEDDLDLHSSYRKTQLKSKQCVRALLGLSVPQYDLICKSLSGDDAPGTFVYEIDVYGIVNLNLLFGYFGDDLDRVENLTDFMGRLGLWQKNGEGKTGKEDFRLFRRILGSRYIQDSRERSDLVIDIAFDRDHPCDPSHAKIDNYNWDTIIRVVKFEHLRRVLGWSPDELNQAIIVFSRNIQSIWDRLDNYITSAIDIIVIRLRREIIDLEIPSLSDALNDSSLRNQMSALVRASFVEAIDKFVLTHISNLVYLLDADAIERIPELVQLDVGGLVQDLLELAHTDMEEIPDDVALEISEIVERLITEEINEPLIEKITSPEFIRLGTGAINERLLAQISHLVRLQEKRAGFPVTELLSWWGPIDTNAGMRIVPPSYEGEEKEPEQVSLYEKVYLDKSLYGKHGEDPQDDSEWSYFVLNSKKTELAYLDHRSAPEQISAHRAIVCAALQITERELSTLVASICGTDADCATLGLTLNNLSALYRAVSLVRYLDISVHELALLLKFVGSELDPFKWTHQSEPTKTEATLIFVECVEQIKRSPFEIRDLAYLWQHYADPKEELEYVYDRIDEYLPQLQEGLGEVKDDVSMPVLEGRPISVDEIATMLKEIGLSAGDVTRIGDIIRDGHSGSPDDESFISQVFSFLTSLQIDDLKDLLIDNRHSKLLEEADVYKITDQTLEQLQREGVPDDVRQKLERIDDEYTGEKAFLDAVKTTLESDEMDQYKSLILTHADKSLQKVVDYLTPIFKLSLFISQELGNFFGTSREVVRKLLLVLKSATTADSALLQDFVHWDDSPQARETIRNHILRLEKIVQVVDGWKLTDEEIEHIQTHSEDFNDFAWNSIPIKDDEPYATGPVYEEWSALAEYVQVRNQISVKKGDLIELFVDARDSDKTETVLKRLSGLLNLESSELKLIVKELGYIDDISNPELEHQSLRNGESIKPVIEMAEAIKRCGRSFEVVRSWVGGDAEGESEELTLDASFMLDFDAKPYDQLLQYKQATVQEIRNTVKARCSESQWQEVARNLQDQMRILQRDKLLDFVIAWFLRPGPDRGFIRFDKPEDVYDFLLIDPLVNPCMNTTRLKLAISSVQLFIHRILMGLERDQEEEPLMNEDETTVLADEWKWKKNYRVWEAQQKVFIYPENWIEPELRDNKTPFFQEFESELAQSEIDAPSIVKAFKNYLAKVDEVSHLEVAALAREAMEGASGQEAGEALHVIGRTREEPRTYYYRRRNANRVWLPWERIDLDIDSRVVLFTVYRGRPYLFWPTVKERTLKLGQDNPDDKDNDKHNYFPFLEICFSWSRYEDGIWRCRKKSDKPAILVYDWDYKGKADEAIVYQIRADGNGITIELSVIGSEKSRYRYAWNDDKLTELFLAVKQLPGEIDWEYMMPGWDMFKAGGMHQEHVDLIKEQVETICTHAEAYTRLQLYARSSEPFSLITDALVTGYIGYDFNASGYVASHERIWHGVLGAYLCNLPMAFRNNDDRIGLKNSDLIKVHNALEPLYEIKNSSIDLYRNRYRYLRISNDATSAHQLKTFARVRFDGHRLKPKVTNSLGLREVRHPNNATVQQGLSGILATKAIEDANPVTNSASLDEICFEDNRIVTRDSSSPHRIELRGGQGSALALQSYLAVTEIAWEDPSSLERFFLHHVRDNYYFEYDANTESEKYLCEPFFQPDTGQYWAILDNESLGRSPDRFRMLLDTKEHQAAERALTIDTASGFQFAEDSRCVSFLLTRPHGIYNWEIFFHMPFTIAVRLSQQKKFAEAQQWFHYIFNPLASLDDGGEYLFSVGLHLVAVLDQGGDVPEAITEELTELGYQLPLNPTITVEQPGSWWAIKDSDIFILLENGTLNVYGEEYDEASKYWNFLPLHKLGQRFSNIDLLKLLSFSGANDEQYHDLMDRIQNSIRELAKDPFQPHRVARTYKAAYQKAVVMKYLDNLIEWGDTLFTQDTIESINEATHLYILAAKILGPRPRLVPRPKRRGGDDGTTVRDVTSYSEGMVVAEYETMAVTVEQFPSIAYATLPVEMGQISTMQWFQGSPAEADGSEEPPSTLDERPVFCVPHNEKLLSYWDTVADRLFKVRNCMNIEGVVRELPIFEPPIDPALLVRGQALGIDISELLSDLYAPLPPYRFRVMLQKAYEFCGDVQKLGGALLSALEKKDAEELSLLRSKHERALLKLTESIKKQQIKELRENLKSLHVSLEMAEARFEYYGSRKFENQNEKAQVRKLDIAIGFQIASQTSSLAASIAFASVPQTHTDTMTGKTIVEYGGTSWGHGFDAVSKFLSMIGSIYSHEANLHSIQGSRERRMDDWKFQAHQASKEIKQIKKQILAAEIRLDIAEKELENHQKQQEQAEEIETFMKSKFTNKELYHWMVSQISGIYFQTYRMAVGLAKTAQRCYRHELGEDAASFIGAAHWDNLKKGLLAGEKLQFDLRRMENAYLEQNKREHELTKHVSLAMLDPVALVMLKETGECYVNLPEAIFDLGYPGHYMRRIKSVSLTIPCVTGPYTNVNCTLTLQSNRIRKDTDTSPEYAWGGDYDDGRFLYDVCGIQAISTSSARDDSGLFELNFHDERYLPFEGAGAISTWHIELPKQFHQFDYDTISDVVIHVRYTARDGGPAFKTIVEGGLTDALNDMILEASREGLWRLFSVKQEFPNEWHRFFQLMEYEDEDTGETKYKHRLQLELSAERFPYLFRENITIKGINLFLKLGDLGEGVEYEDDHPLAYDLKKGGISQVQDDQERNRFKTYVTPEGETVVGLLAAEPFQGQGKPLAEDTTWWFEVEEEFGVEGGGIIPIPAPLQQTATIKGEEHACLKPAVIEDLVIICHYSVTG